MFPPPPAAIAAGDFAQRVKLSGRGDEFDLLAEMINDMLDRIGRLMDGVRQVSNAIAHDLRTPITRARARLEEAATARRDRRRATRCDRARDRRPRWHRCGVPRLAADRRDRGWIATLGIHRGWPWRRCSAGWPSFMRRWLKKKTCTSVLDVPPELAGLWRPGTDPAGGREPGGQRGQVLAPGRHGRGRVPSHPAARHGDHRCRSRAWYPGSRSRRGPPSGSSVARPPAARPARGLASRWSRRSPSCMAASCG